MQKYIIDDITIDIIDVICYTHSMNTTTQVTLRNVSRDLKRRIDQNAHKRGTSINTYLLEVIQSALQGKQPHGWREFSGSIPDKGINSEALAQFEEIDTEMWRS